MDNHSHPPARVLQRRALWIALTANAAFLIVEVVGGVVFNSLALLADAAHMFSDVFSLSVALIAQSLMLRPASERHTYGLQRAEVLGAQINGLSLLVVAGWIGYEAAQRLSEPVDTEGTGILVVAALGLIVNLASAQVIKRSLGRSLNMRGAYLHMLADAAGSVGAIVAGLAVALWDAQWADPTISVAIAILVIWSAWNLFRETTRVLLEGTPKGLRVQDVERALEEMPSIASTHHVHIWNLASDTPALSAHVVLEGKRTLHEAQLEGDEMKTMLVDRFGIEHSTLELECHTCEPDSRGNTLDDVAAPASER
jgi:cobalt-zinc-cadmium efflux system protein